MSSTSRQKAYNAYIASRRLYESNCIAQKNELSTLRRRPAIVSCSRLHAVIAAVVSERTESQSLRPLIRRSMVGNRVPGARSSPEGGESLVVQAPTSAPSAAFRQWQT